MRSFRGLLMLSYVPLVVVPVLLVGLVTRNVAEQGLTLLVTDNAQEHIRVLVPCFTTYYQLHGSWDGIETILKPSTQTGAEIIPLNDGNAAGSGGHFAFAIANTGHVECYRLRGNTLLPIGPPPGQAPGNPNPSVPPIANTDQNGGLEPLPEATLLLDSAGNVLATTGEQQMGEKVAPELLNQSQPIFRFGQVIGRLVIGTVMGGLTPQQRQLLDAVNIALLASGAVSVLLAVCLGWWMSWRISRPVRTLMSGVKQLATGKWTTPLEVQRKDELGELTGAFNHMASEIIRVQNLNRQMVADVAHDLRTPLSAMALEVEAIEAGFQTPADATASLREEITWLQRMVEDLRTLSLMDADQMRLNVEPTPLQPFLEGIYDFWQIMAEEEGRCLILDTQPDLPTFSLDKGRMRQTLNNLIDNAIRHTHAGNRITIRGTVNGDRGIIQVCDEGEGIRPEDLPYIFDRFYRADISRGHGDAHHYLGSGLGLSIARRLVEMHGGSIEVESQLGHGTTFTIALPFAQI